MRAIASASTDPCSPESHSPTRGELASFDTRTLRDHESPGAVVEGQERAVTRGVAEPPHALPRGLAQPPQLFDAQAELVETNRKMVSAGAAFGVSALDKPLHQS